MQRRPPEKEGARNEARKNTGQGRGITAVQGRAGQGDKQNRLQQGNANEKKPRDKLRDKENWCGLVKKPYVERPSGK